MNLIKMYAIYDKKAEIYDTPLFFLKEQMAKRWFMQMCFKKEGRFEYFQDDLELHCICSFNVLNGKISNYDPEGYAKIVLEGIQIGKENKNANSDAT